MLQLVLLEFPVAEKHRCLVHSKIRRRQGLEDAVLSPSLPARFEQFVENSVATQQTRTIWMATSHLKTDLMKQMEHPQLCLLVEQDLAKKTTQNVTIETESAFASKTAQKRNLVKTFGEKRLLKQQQSSLTDQVHHPARKEPKSGFVQYPRATSPPVVQLQNCLLVRLVAVILQRLMAWGRLTSAVIFVLWVWNRLLHRQAVDVLRHLMHSRRVVCRAERFQKYCKNWVHCPGQHPNAGHPYTVA